jgi:hypothetical protein
VRLAHRVVQHPGPPADVCQRYYITEDALGDRLQARRLARYMNPDKLAELKRSEPLRKRLAKWMAQFFIMTGLIVAVASAHQGRW